MGILQGTFSKKNRALLHELVKTDFKLRYQGSAVGYLWSLLKPLFMFAILYVVFTSFIPLGGNVPHYPVYLFLGMIFWGFFTETTQLSVGSIVGRGDLIRKVKIPRWMIVVSVSLNALINLSLNLVVLVVFMIINKVDLMVTIAWLPLLIVEVYLFALGCSFFLASAFVKYRDIQYIWDVLLQAGFYLTPILYPLTMIDSHFVRELMFMNPLAQAIQDARWAVVAHDSSIITIRDVFINSWHVLTPFIIVVVVLVGGIAYFRSQQDNFAENL